MRFSDRLWVFMGFHELSLLVTALSRAFYAPDCHGMLWTMSRHYHEHVPWWCYRRYHGSSERYHVIALGLLPLHYCHPYFVVRGFVDGVMVANAIEVHGS